MMNSNEPRCHFYPHRHLILLTIVVFLILSSAVVPSQVSCQCDPSIEVVVGTGREPIDLALGSDRLFVSNQGWVLDGDWPSISVIDRGPDTLLHTITDIDAAEAGRGISFDEGERLIFWGYRRDCSFDCSEWVTAIGENGEQVWKTETGGTIGRMCINSATRRLYVTNNEYDAVQVFDADLGWYVAYIPVLGQPLPITCDPATNRIFVGTSTGWIFVIDGVTNTIVDAAIDGYFPYENFAIDEERDLLYAVGGGTSLRVFNRTSLELIATVEGLRDPRGIALNPDANCLYVSEFCGFDDIKVLDGTSFEVLATVPVAACPFDLALCDSTHRIYVANSAADAVTSLQDMNSTFVDESEPFPKEVALYQNYPNPFNPTTKIEFTVPVASHVILVVYDILGREVSTLVNKFVPAGYSVVTWKGVDASGRTAGNGVYFYRLTAMDERGSMGFSETRKMILLK